MKEPVILILDDYENYLKMAEAALNKSGYIVKVTQELREARRILSEGGIDLAIIDIRLINDPENKKERTGLDFAQKYTHKMPVIIVSSEPEKNWDILREAFHQFNGNTPVMDFVFKEEGVTSLIAAVDRVLHHRTNVMEPHVSIWGDPDRSAQFQCDLFMIMPFDDKFTGIYELAIKPAIESLHMTVKRGDVFHSKAAIISEVWSAISNAKLIVADCTGKNANVFYELGIAHTLGKNYILLTQEVDDIPFDLRHLRFIVYEDTNQGLVRLKADLMQAININLAPGND